MVSKEVYQGLFYVVYELVIRQLWGSRESQSWCAWAAEGQLADLLAGGVLLQPAGALFLP